MPNAGGGSRAPHLHRDLAVMLAIPYEAEPRLSAPERNRAVGEGSGQAVEKIWHCVLASQTTVIKNRASGVRQLVDKGSRPAGAETVVEFTLPTRRFVLEDRVSDVSDAVAVYVQAPPAPFEAIDLDALPRIEDLNDPCVGSASFSDIRPGRCPLPLRARAGGFGCFSRRGGNGLGRQLARSAGRQRWCPKIAPVPYP